MLDFLSSPELHLSKKSTNFLDLGTGNGEILFLLREKGGFEGRMLGVDYSEKSVDLARKIVIKKEMARDIEFQAMDILDNEMNIGEFEVVLDKGTFDAICLSGRSGVEALYRDRVQRLVKPGGLLLLTSCNWTEEEVRQWIEGGNFTFYGRIKYPVFRFGGQIGQTITSTCFRRRE